MQLLAVSSFSQLLKTFLDDLVEQFYPSCDLLSRFCLHVFVQVTLLDEIGKEGYVAWKKHGVMKKFLMAVIAKDRSPAFNVPWAFLEYFVSLGPTTVVGPPEESFCHKMVS